MDAPKSPEKQKLVKLLASYILSDGSHVAVQGRAYARYMAFFETLETKYPRVAFRGEETQASLVRAAKTKASEKLFRGPGATF